MKEKIIGLSIIGITLGMVTLVGVYNSRVEQELTEKQEVIIETEEVSKEIVNIIETPVEIAIRNEEGTIDHYENKNIKIEMWTEDYGYGKQKVYIKNLSDYEFSLEFIYKYKNNDEDWLVVYTHLEPNGISNLMNDIMYDENNIFPFYYNDDYDGYGVDYLDGYSFDGGLTVYSSGYHYESDLDCPYGSYELKDINVSFLNTIDSSCTFNNRSSDSNMELNADTFQYIPNTDNVFNGHDIFTNFDDVKITQYYK